MFIKCSHSFLIHSRSVQGQYLQYPMTSSQIIYSNYHLCPFHCMVRNMCTWTALSLKIIKKQSHYWPGQAQRVPGGWGSQISWHPAHEGGKVVSFMHWLPLPPRNIPGTHFWLYH